jgi:hypothetical protein
MIDSSWGATHLRRNEVFSSQVKEMFRDELYAKSWVKMTSELPDGDNLKINSFGSLTIDQGGERVSLPSRRMDTGQFIFNIPEFVGVKAEFTDEFFEDNFMANEVLTRTPVEMMRAFDEYFEGEVLSIGNNSVNGQTINNANMINERRHRFTANGAGRRLSLQDFAYAKSALKKAKVPMTNLVAIVDPSVEFELDITTTITDISNNPTWEGIIETGMGTGTRFIRNIYGFDVYTSDFLDTATVAEAALTDYQGNTTASVVGDKAALFFSAAPEASPFLGAFRRTPGVKSWRDEDISTEFHQMTARFGLGLYRPENLVTIWHTDTLS